MSSNKSLAFAVCLVVTGCAQSPQNGAAEGGSSWWPFGSDKVAEKAPDHAAAAKPDLKAAATAPAAKVDAKTPAAAVAAPVVANADSETHWWWPFDSKKEKDAPKPLLAVRSEAVPMPDPKITQAWLDDYEPRMRLAIKDSPFQLERRENVLVIIAPADSSFNHDRPTMLLPVTLGPISRLAKMVEADPKTAVLVLGHADTAGVEADNLKLSQDRASSVAAIFHMSGLQRDRLGMRGLGGLMPRAANDSVEGRKQNRRIEILMTPQVTMVALLAKYNMPAPAPILVAAQAAPPVVAAPAAKTTKKAATGKKSVKKPAAKKPAAKKAAAKKATPTKAEPAKPDAPAAPAAPADSAKAN